MGQKVNPNGIRLGITKPFSSTWYAGTKQFPSYLQGDFAVRNYLTAKLKDASVSKIIIDRPAKSIKVTIRTARPGIVVGKSGANIEPLRLEVEKLAGVPAQIKVVEIHHGKEEIEAQLVANSIADQLEHRVMFRRAIKKAVQNALRAGAKGIKVQVSGRLGGAEISRKPSGSVRDAFLCIHSVPISTMLLLRHRLPTVSSASRYGSSRAKSSAKCLLTLSKRMILSLNRRSPAVSASLVQPDKENR